MEPLGAIVKQSSGHLEVSGTHHGEYGGGGEPLGLLRDAPKEMKGFRPFFWHPELGPKMVPKEPKMAPRWPQHEPRKLQRWPQDAIPKMSENHRFSMIFKVSE